MKTSLIWFIALLFAVALAGCQGSDESLTPPDIRYGEDVCDHCNMIINEPRFAAAYATEAGDIRRFDDIGEMFLYAAERGEDVRTFWVHDFGTEDWIEASGATYVHNPALMTPMGWGIAAFRDNGGAQAYSDAEGGDLMSFTELQAQVQEGELAPQGMARHDH